MGPLGMSIGAGFARLEEKSGDRIEFLVVDSSLARAFFHGIPAARLLARAATTTAAGAAGDGPEDLLRTLLRPDSTPFDAVRKAVARHARVARDEGTLQASE